MPRTKAGTGAPASRGATAYAPPTWPLNVAIVIALGSAFAGLNTILEGSSWWFVVIGIIIAVTFGMAAVRAFLGWVGWSPLAGIVVLTLCLSFSFASAQSLIGFIPTLETLARFTAHMNEGFLSISGQGVPAKATQGIVFILAAGAGLLTIAMDAVVIIAKRPAIAGLPLLVLLAVPSFFLPGEADPWTFAITAGAFLLLLYLGIGEPRTGGAMGVAASALAVALILPVVAPPANVEPDDISNGTGFTIGINTFIALGDNLRRPNPSRVLEYATNVNHGQYLTVSSISNFTGSEWKPAAPGTAEGPDGLLTIGPVPGLDDDIAVEQADTVIDIRNMGGRFAPVPYAPSRVIGLSEDWSFDPESLTISSIGDSARGAEYEVRSVLATPTLQQLRAAGPVPSGFELYLAMPEGLDASVADTARSVVEEADANTAIDQALALQSYFTSGDFIYSEQAPVEEGYDGSSAQVVGRFLEEKRGYCVHFSSAMAVMARSLGIPARIAVGFTPGEYIEGNGEDPAYYVVTTANLHAWPELYFDGIGWVRFEPTVGRGETPSFEDEDDDSPDASNAPSATPSASASASASASPSASPSPSSTPGATGNDFANLVIAAVTVGALALGAVIVLLLPLVPGIVRLARRLRRYWRVSRRQSAADAWAEVSDTAIDLGWKAAATTPQEFEDLVRPGMPDKATAALERLRSAIEFTAYSRTPEPARIADVRTVRRAMRSVSSRNDRMRARFSPRSVVLKSWRRR